MPKIPGIRPAIPTQTIDAYWVYAYHKSSAAANASGSNYGKWMLFYAKPVLDEKWERVKNLLEQGLLGDAAKCSTAKENPNATSSKTGVIIVYTSDYTDQDDVYRVAKVLYDELEYGKTMYYKTDDQTYAGLYANRGSKKNHTYHYPK
ncbi:hypothetical protein BGZ80_003952 [Entomortierella chlamydospora]|uniref:Uncharacterized protein n=1 Tax=Entomortierella chlamydospora TaxID=101097 RepID=A0A9P6N0H8_9FUNG|nr:hypothetical protein BGZ80_003952 [Entomortierella chlamydospora]